MFAFELDSPVYLLLGDDSTPDHGGNVFCVDTGVLDGGLDHSLDRRIHGGRSLAAEAGDAETKRGDADANPCHPRRTRHTPPFAYGTLRCPLHRRQTKARPL